MLDPASIWPSAVRPLRRIEYQRMVEQGLFEHEHIELIQGALVTMGPQGARHFETIKRFNRILMFALGTRAQVLVQSPLAIAEDSEPQPDLAVVPIRDYSAEVPSHAHLVVEVAEASLRKDRGVKAALYAAAAIPEYWIADLTVDMIEVYTQPHANGYSSMARCKRGDVIAPVLFPEVQVAVGDVF
jgi:Uma2 family endonuclease